MTERTRMQRWKAVRDLLGSLERIVQANVIMDIRGRPFRLPEEADAAERKLQQLAAVVESELDRLTAEKLIVELERQQSKDERKRMHR